MLKRIYYRLQDFFLRVKWAFQRAFRGWDDSATFSVDRHIAALVPQLVRVLLKNETGTPGMMFSDADFDENGVVSPEIEAQKKAEWKQILTDIAEGFEEYAVNGDCMMFDGHSEKFEKAFDLFRKYFSALWD